MADVSHVFEFYNISEGEAYIEFLLYEISLQYNVPTNKLTKLGIQNLAITLAGNNLHYFTAVKGVSPEVGASTTYNKDYYNYPPIRKYSVGVKVTF